MARIAVGGFQHETNCFVTQTTDFDYFLSHRDRPPLVRGGELLRWLNGTTFAMAGFLREMGTQARATIVPLVWASGGAGGTVTRDAFERITGELIGALSVSLPVDAVYLDLHGAMVSEDFEDGEGELLRRVRAAVGPAVPIVASLDYHGNVTPGMVAMADGLIGYRTYPHVDRVETGVASAKVLSTLLRSGRPAGRALRKMPFLIPLNDQSTLVEPSRGIARRARILDGDLFSLSYLAGFPPSDLLDCGPAVVAYGATQQAADAAADALASEIEAKEGEFAQAMLPVKEGVAKAIEASKSGGPPVVLADTQDNPGCGGTADTTGVLAELVAQGAEHAALGYFCDPEAAEAAHAAGVGADIVLDLGGRHGPAGVEPFHATFRVRALSNGQLRTTGPVSGNRNVDLGAMALLVTGGVSIAVTSKRFQAHDAAPFEALGIDPIEQSILVLKSTCHFRAVFEPLAQEVMVVLAPGGYLADPARYPYRRLRAGVRLRPLGTSLVAPS